MPSFSWDGGMWIFPFMMMIGMFVLAFLVCRRGARRVFGPTVFGNRWGVPREDPLEILKSRYANGEITSEEFGRIREELGGASSA